MSPNSRQLAFPHLDSGPRVTRPSRVESARGLAQSALWRAALVLCLLGAATGTLARAQYTLEGTTTGGGGTSASGDYSLSGAVGQPGAGTMSGGDFTLTGGSWNILAVIETPGAPTLTIYGNAANGVVISWPVTAGEGWRLETTPHLAPPISWTEVPPPYAVADGTHRHVAEPVPAGGRFYRLRGP